MTTTMTRLAQEIKAIHVKGFDTICEMGRLITEAQWLGSKEEFKEFCAAIAINMADCSRYVAVYELRDWFDRFPELKTLGTGKIFSLLSIIKAGNIEDFIDTYGLGGSMADMKENIRSHKAGGTTSPRVSRTDAKDAEIARLQAALKQAQDEAARLQAENFRLRYAKQPQQTASGRIDKPTAKKLLKFIHPDLYQQYGQDIVDKMTEASKIVNGLAM